MNKKGLLGWVLLILFMFLIASRIVYVSFSGTGFAIWAGNNSVEFALNTSKITGNALSGENSAQESDDVISIDKSPDSQYSNSLTGLTTEE